MNEQQSDQLHHGPEYVNGDGQQYLNGDELDYS